MTTPKTRLTAMLRRAASTTPTDPRVAEAVEAAIAEAPEEQFLTEAALEGWQKVAADEEITDDQMFAVEAIVLPLLRPVFDVINDSFHAPPPPWRSLDEQRPVIEAAIQAVGRVEIVGHPSVPYGGTGFLVGSDLILTNRHVAELFTQGVGMGHIRFHTGRRTGVDFKQEVLPSEPMLLDFVEPLLVHPYWDAALLRVQGAEGRTPLRLSGSEPHDLDGRSVVVIGYPAFDPRQDAQLQYRIFRAMFERKRLQPGTCMGYRTITSYGHVVEGLAHDCSTLGGNSGSAVLDMVDGQVLGLHFAGEYLKANYAVPAWALAGDQRVADLGVGFTARPSAPADWPWLRAWAGVDDERTTAAAADASDEKAPSVMASPALVRPPALGGDWYERVSDDDVTVALMRDFDGTFALLVEALGPDQAGKTSRELARTQSGQRPVQPGMPEIVFIHGILGGHLDEHSRDGRSRIWLAPQELVQGDLARRLALGNGAEARVVQAGSHLRVEHAAAARKWRAGGLIVHEFSYDWRRPLEEAADRLHLYVEGLHVDRPQAQVALVAHSTGGLVACLYARRHPTWSDRVQRAVFMGVPLGGTFAPVEAVVGSHPLFQKLAWLSVHNELDDLRQVAATLPGLLDCLPNPDVFSGSAQLYTQAGWPADATPRQQLLDHSRNLKAAVLTSPLLERTTHLVSISCGTVASVVSEDGNIACGPQTAVGDGIVPAQAAVLDGLPCYTVDGRNNDIPRDPAAIHATIDLITTGTCRLRRVRSTDLSTEAALAEPTPPELPEGAQLGIRERLAAGRLRRDDVDWLLAPDFSDLPEP